MTFADLTKRYPRLFELAQWSNCPPGWVPIVARLCEQIADTDVQITQLKDKFGGLRIYYLGGDERVNALVDAAEDVSLTMCETCGNLGVQHISRSGWISTRCEQHKP